MRLRWLFVSLAAASLAGSALAWHFKRAAEDPYGLVFEFVGCKGDWPEDLPTKPIISREAGAPATFRVRDPASCGMAPSDPAYKVDGRSLSLSYSLHAVRADGAVAACYCEYESRFSFLRLPAEVRDISFSHD